MEQNELDRLQTAAQVAQRLGVPPKRIRAAIRSGDIPAVRIGEWWRVRERDVAAWVDRQRWTPEDVAP